MMTNKDIDRLAGMIVASAFGELPSEFMTLAQERAMITSTVTCDVCNEEIPPDEHRVRRGLRLGQIVIELKPTSQQHEDNIRSFDSAIHVCGPCMDRVLKDGSLICAGKHNEWPGLQSDAPIAAVRRMASGEVP